MPEVTIGKKLVNSILHSMTGKYIVYAVQILSMMILARLFSPETFGVFAVIQVFSVFFALVSEMGFGPALINEPNISKKMRDGIYSFTWALGFFISLVFLSVTPLISYIYNNEIYQVLVIPVAVSIIFNTAIIVPLASFQRDKKFISLARYESMAEIISVVIVIFLLNYVEPIWALAIKPLSVSFVRFILVYYGSKSTEVGTASFGSELMQIKKILYFSKHQAGFNFLNYFSRNLDNILVGKYLGTISLGVYDKAYQLMRYPLMLLTFAMSPAIQPVMKELNNNLGEFERLHNKLVLYISILGLIVGALFYFLAEYIVLILLGEQWSAVIPIIKVLSLSIPIQIVMSTSGGFYQAAGRADLLLVCGAFSAFTNVIAIVVGIFSGSLVYLSWCLLISFSINYIQCYYIMGRYLFLNGCLPLFKNLSLSLLGVLVLSVYAKYFSFY